MALTHQNLGNRYKFTGTLVFDTGMHIGSGRGSTLTDALVIRTAGGEPYVPGSSFKGALRSAVERIAPNLNALTPPVTTCQLIDGAACITTSSDLRNNFQKLQENCDKAQRTGQSYWTAFEDQSQFLITNGICTQEELQTRAFIRQLPYRFIEHYLCDTCKLFGSTQFAAKVRVGDLRIQGQWVEMTEIRDGVGIDRDTETAKPKVKFDLEVVPVQTEFAFRLEGENLSARDLGLLCIGIQEFRTGMVPLGGRTTRGLGSCRLNLEGVYSRDLSNPQELVAYLTATNDENRMAPQNTNEFIIASIRALLAQGGA